MLVIVSKPLFFIVLGLDAIGVVSRTASKIGVKIETDFLPHLLHRGQAHGHAQNLIHRGTKGAFRTALASRRIVAAKARNLVDLDRLTAAKEGLSIISPCAGETPYSDKLVNSLEFS